MTPTNGEGRVNWVKCRSTEFQNTYRGSECRGMTQENHGLNQEIRKFTLSLLCQCRLRTARAVSLLWLTILQACDREFDVLNEVKRTTAKNAVVLTNRHFDGRLIGKLRQPKSVKASKIGNLQTWESRALESLNFSALNCSTRIANYQWLSHKLDWRTARKITEKFKMQSSLEWINLLQDKPFQVQINCKFRSDPTNKGSHGEDVRLHWHWYLYDNCKWIKHD